MIVAPQESGLSSNMVTTAETFAGSLTDYVDANKKALQTSVPDARLLSDAEFVTDGKMTGRKVKLQNKMKDIDLAQTMYFFEGANGRKVIVTCTAPAKFGSGPRSALRRLHEDFCAGGKIVVCSVSLGPSARSFPRCRCPERSPAVPEVTAATNLRGLSLLGCGIC